MTLKPEKGVKNTSDFTSSTNQKMNWKGNTKEVGSQQYRSRQSRNHGRFVIESGVLCHSVISKQLWKRKGDESDGGGLTMNDEP